MRGSGIDRARGTSIRGANAAPLRREWVYAALLTLACACSTDQQGGGGASPGPFTLTPGAGGPPTAGGAVIAQLELSAPSSSSFVLHGTIPVPQGKFPRADGKLPFAIRDTNGFVVPTQVEVVSRYANDQDGADVVEVLGRVHLPSGTVPGQKIQYQVVEHLHATARLPIKKDVLKLLTQPAQALLVSHDCFGNAYSLDLFETIRGASPTSFVKTMRQGPAAVQMRTYGVMHPTQGTPVGAPTGALSHMFGVHGYVTAWALEDFVSLDVRVNNGASGLDKAAAMQDDDPLGLVYFKDLEIWVPNGWQVLSDITDPFLGGARAQGGWTAYPLVKPNADGSMHVMPTSAMFHRRLSITKPAAVALARTVLDEATLGFCKRGPSPDGGALYSWWNPLTARYWPSKHPMPDLSHLGTGSIQGNIVNTYNQTKSTLENGTFSSYPYALPVLGWAHPWGVKYGGMTSGSEVWMYDGFKTAEASSREGYRSAALTHRMYCERQPQVFFDADGEHTQLEQWVLTGPNGPYVPMNFFQKLLNGSNDPFGIAQSKAYQRTWVQQNSLQPAYEAELLACSAIDFQHYTRFLHSPMTLAWLGNDALAKDDLVMAAEIFRMSYHEYSTSANNGGIPSTLQSDLQSVGAHPGRGFAFGRGEAWGIVSALAAYNLSDTHLRARYQPWLERIDDMVAAGQSSCSGFIQSNFQTKTLNGQWLTRQSIEQAITENMLWGLKESVFRDADAARLAQTEQVLVDSCYAMIGPMAWNTSAPGPWSHLAVAPLNTTLAPYCGTLPAGGAGNGTDNYQTPSSYAYGYELTGDAMFLTRAAEALAGGSANLLNALKGQGFNNLENKAALIAVLQ